MKLQELINTGIKALHSNGGRRQEIILINEKDEKYRIINHSESYDNQSYARLCKWCDSKGWQTIVNKNPKHDYGIDIAYSSHYSQDIFAPIVRDFKQLITHF